MKTLVRMTVTLLFLTGATAPAFPDQTQAQGTTEKGAKALFADSLSGAEIQASGGGKVSAKKPPQKTSAEKKTAPAAPASATASAASTGLMYWVELLRPSGEAVRVTTDHLFHSGDRIRVHLSGSVDGDVAVYQRDSSGHAVQLFPDARVNGGSARVLKGVSTIIPPAPSWFRFDEQVGTERLLIVLTPQPQIAPPVQRTAPLMAAAERIDRDYDQMGPADGSKGLVLETDTSSTEPATYVVRPIASGTAPTPISVEVILRHER